MSTLAGGDAMISHPDKAKDIFLSAVELASADERQAYLDSACPGNTSLRREVEELLGHHERMGGFLQSPGIRPAASAIFPAVHEGPGTIVGPYELLEPLGEGGMGTVFQAAQTAPVQRQVALKIIKPGMDSRHIIARFEAERQALALMDHPHIAKVLDAGTTASGRPYFVMELVRGVPITRYCDERRLTLRQRLELFVPVCQAVQHAHQKGVIHRDLKPSNVLVAEYDGEAVPKVIDFGVAKATGPQLTERSVCTEIGQVVGTLEYMSPEQAELNALDIDTRSDIYALGVLLYELLTGTTPLDRKRLTETALLDVLRIIREEEPPQPSRRLSTVEELPSIAANRGVEPKQLSGLVRGELDWIVMKCLEKDRSRRYETANGLARDLERYLHDEPVQACPPSTGYRLRKFVRRNKVPVLAASLIVLALLAGIAGSTWQAVRATQAEGRTTDALERVTREQATTRAALTAETTARRQTWAALKAMTDDVIEKLLARQPQLGAAEKEFLRKVLTYYETFAKDQRETEEARSTAAWAQHRVAWLRAQLGATADAETAYNQAVAMQERLVADFPGVPGYRADLAYSHNNLGKVLFDLGKRAASEKAVRRALEVREQLASEFPDVPDYRHQLADSYHNLGNVLSGWGEREEAGTAYRQAVAVREKLVADLPAVPRYRQGLGLDYQTLGTHLSNLGKHAEAAAAHRQAVALEEKLATDFPTHPEYREALAFGQTNLGGVLRALGKWSDAETVFRQALALQQQLVAEFPAVPSYRRQLALSHHNLGVVLRGLGKRAEAEAAFRQALALRQQLAADFPAVPNYRSALAETHNDLGIGLHDQGKQAEAEAAHRQALALREKLAADNPAIAGYRQDLAESHSNLGLVLSARQKPREAEAAYRAALALQEKLVIDFPAVPLNRRRLATTYNSLGLLLRDLGRDAEAETAHHQALAVREKLVADFPAAPDHRLELAGSYVNHGHLVRTKGQPEAALPWFDKAVSLLEALLATDKHLASAQEYLRNAHWGRARALFDLRRYPETLSEYTQAMEYPPEAGSLWRERAECFARLGRWGEAAADFGQASRRTPDEPSLWYYEAVAHLAAQDRDGYRRACAGMLERFDKPEKPSAANWGVWTCMFLPDAVADFRPLVRLDEQVLERDPRNWYFLTTLGGARYRIGQFQESIATVEAACRVHGNDGNAHNWFFLALAHHRLGHREEARRWLDKAVQWLEQATAGKIKDTRTGSPLPWYDRVLLEVLRREAEALILEKPAPETTKDEKK
jgi:serine/threonine protein kinase/tetratricopeptide (TPR) repeat protein